MEVVTSRMRFYNQPRDAVLPYVPASKCPTYPCEPCLGALVDSKYVYIPGLYITVIFCKPLVFGAP